MRSIKKSLVTISLMCILVVLTAVAAPSYIFAAEPVTTAKLVVDKIPNVINRYMDAINDKDWDSFVKSYSPERQRDYVNFPSQYQTENRTGILSVDSIRIYEAKEIPATHITEIEPYFSEINNSLYNNIRYYYIGFDYKVNKESEFFYNGIRYELLAIGSLNGTEYIIGHENVYHLSRLDAFGYTFNSDAEKRAQNIVDQKERGIIVNFNNDTISSNIDDSNEKSQIDGENIQQRIEKDTSSLESDIKDKPKSGNTNAQELNNLEKASQGKDNGLIQPQSSASPPSTFKLYITSTGTVIDIGFDPYAKCVLPNEWYAS